MKFIKLLLTVLPVCIVGMQSANAGMSQCEILDTRIKNASKAAEYAKYNMRPAEAANAMIHSKRRINNLKQKYSDLGCDGSTPKAERMKQQKQYQSTIGSWSRSGEKTSDTKARCIEQCKEYTSRSDEECFDSCWK